jgi:nucleoside-diphosphate-sugar epimerase
MPRAMIIGGTGAVGRATSRRLLSAGWEVDVIGRDAGRMAPDIAAGGGRFLKADRSDIRQLRAAYGGGADLIVDCLCFTAADARVVMPLVHDASATVMISTKLVYVDPAGRPANAPLAPRFDGPIRETSATLLPGSVSGATAPTVHFGANKVAAEQVLLESGAPVTVLRPSKIHGDGASPPREWVFVKRVLDKRPAVFLAERGQGRDHTAAAANIAALVETAAAKPGRRILNIADPDAPTAREIAHVIADYLGHSWHEFLLDGSDDVILGRTPWDTVHPIVLDTTAALELGYTPVGDYATTVVETIESLVAASSAGQRLPDEDDPYLGMYLDYSREDRYLSHLAA